MSSELKKVLYVIAEEEYENRKRIIDQEIEHYEHFILTIARNEKIDLKLEVEGAEIHPQEEKELDLLEKSNLIKGQTKYTHRNMFKEYRLTEKGTELVKKLTSEA